MQNQIKRRRRSLMVSVSERTLAINSPGVPASSWCPDCAEQVHMMRPDEAAFIAAITPRTVYQWIEAGKVHFAEEPGGLVRVCLNSLPGSETARAGFF